MPWYKSGTVSVAQNSNAVIGTGTAFIANSRVGDAFRGPDGGWYEVTNIASDTALSISPNYQGAITATGAYALAPMQGYVKDSADALRAIVNQYGPKLAALGTTGNYDLLPVSKGGTGITDLSVFMQGLLSKSDAAAGRGVLVAAKSGANADITALSGLTTALSVGQGGNGNTTGTATRLAAAAIVGPVSQAAGVPTGAIIEIGSTANGEYVKFANGTQICRLGYSGTLALDALLYGAYVSGWITWTFPAGFIARPNVIVTPKDDSALFGFVSASGNGGIENIRLGQNATSGASVRSANFVAFGRWF